MKKIALITVDSKVMNSFMKQLNEVFKGEVVIDSFKFDLNGENEFNLSAYDLIVCSSKAIFKDVEKLVPPGKKIVVVRRAINLDKLNEVMKIKVGEKVLLVSNHPYTAEETIKLLRELGIDYLEYIPYYPGCKVEDAKIAITPGGSHLVPGGVKKVIDLGVKIIDISSLVEIFFNLGLPLEETNLLTARYAKEILRHNKYISEINSILKTVIDVINEGIVVMDISGNILFFNEGSKRILDIENDFNLKNISELSVERKNAEMFLNMKEYCNEIIKIGSKKVMFNKRLLKSEDNANGIVLSLNDITRIQRLEYEIRKNNRKKGFISKYTFDDLVGVNENLINAINIAKKIAKTDLTVLIQGENGTGKEIFAQAIHNESKRKDGPFVAVNFSSLSETLAQTELFGYEEGSFTGSKKGGKSGLFEYAHNGTLFIDEIGDISPNIQVQLLRVLQEKEIMRLGGNGVIPVDVRIIAATNKNLKKLVEEGKFRKDLYYRIKVLSFRVPPLRERKQDIPYLVKYFFKKDGSKKHLTKEVLDLFNKHSWPGNVRELENMVYYIENIVEHDEVVIGDLSDEFIEEVRNGEEDNSEFIYILDLLKEKEWAEDCKYILEELLKYKSLNKKVGRNRIFKNLKNKGRDITDDKVRIRMKYLENSGLISIGKTKEGSTITEKGKEFLNFIK
ncbi:MULTISPECIES: sigma 54-interacting transcriptional regulator [Tissierellales]|uniref:AAA family ATPase n=1 Tax=Acidilutibacter cellobiosedens TaxID=2507161 RepID=A0A410QH39_9FIRM|nr:MULTISPECIES: sigma 54-interacting transcriptional regulator [Tissierellales]QAT63276.1 AAA family ATPase [Acidilutibacter cellobiosedens]SCL95809.1 Nif-specific regulatory protein [Sporanaerobacter sp. PP17-6a]